MTILERSPSAPDIGAQSQQTVTESGVATSKDAGQSEPTPPASPSGDTERTNEQSMGRAVRLGALIGIPATFLVAFVIGILGGAGPVASVAIGLWVGGFSGTYLGGIFFLPSGPDDSGNAT